MSEESTTSNNQFDYQGSLEIQLKDRWIYTDYFNVNQCPDIQFNISVKRIENKKMTIRVSKFFTKSAIAVIKLVIDDMVPISKYVTSWTNDIIFDSLAIPSNCDACPKYNDYSDIYCRESHNPHKYNIPITCSIIWHGFTSDLLNARLNKNIETYFNNSEFSDVKIIVKNNEEFPAHKIILASSSPVFKKMLTTDMKESRENCITLPELDADTVTELLYFLYHGKLDKAGHDNLILSKLLEVAEMYCMPDLKNFCEDSLINNLSSDNFILLLELSRGFNLVNLRRHTLTFIANNMNSLCQ